METSLYKNRSLAKCSQAAYMLFSTNIRHIITRTWMPALVIALLSAALLTLVMPHVATAEQLSQPAVFAPLLLLIAALFVADTWFKTSLTGMLSGIGIATNFRRNLYLNLLLVGISAAYMLFAMLMAYLPYQFGGTMTALEQLNVTIGIYMFSMLIAAVISTPLLYSIMKYLMEPDKKLNIVLGRAYMRGWRSWGFLFMNALLTGIIVSMLAMMVFMPSSIVGMAQQLDTTGIGMGDPTGLPDIFPAIAFLATLLSVFIWCYVQIWGIMVFYYAYGTIEARKTIHQQEREIRASTGNNAIKVPDIDL